MTRRDRTPRPPRPTRGPGRQPLASSAAALAAGLAALGVSAGPAEGQDAAPGVALLEPGVADLADETVADLRRHAGFFADPALGGRLPGTPGIERAANYLQLHAMALGLRPAFAGPDGRPSFRQRVDIGDRNELVSASAALVLPGEESSRLEQGEDFTVLGHGSGGEVDLPVTFAGYGIVAGEDGYLGFAHNADFAGRAVMVLRFEPMDDDGRSLWNRDPAGAQAWSYHAGLRTKLNAVARRNASAILLVTPPGADDPRVGVLDRFDQTPPTGERLGVPVLHVSAAAADRLVRAGDPSGRSLDDLIVAANREGVTVDLDDRARLVAGVKIDDTPIDTANLGAVLPGRGGLADEHVVLGAHYDHIGLGLFGTRSPERRGEVHPGADDNASGTAAVLAAAELLAEAYAGLPEDAEARSVLFLWFTAEETGLEGSDYYADNPPFPIGEHYAMLNMDMVGRLREGRLEVGGIGTGAGLAGVVEPLFDDSGLNVATSLSIGFGRSDHASFDRRGVPSLFFFTGLHDDYHAVADTVDKLNFEGAARVATLAAEVALALATREDGLPYADSRNARDEPAAPVSGVRVRVGIMPGDYFRDNGGVLIRRVFDGTAASEAGLERGDRIVRWGEADTPNVAAWMPLLAEHEPGDEVDVTVIRDDEEVGLTIRLRARGGRD